MTKLFLIIAAIADLALAAVLYTAAVAACVALPVAGFVLDRKGKAPLGLALAWLPPD
ncbi:MAG: hypothetical protein Q7V40_09200 [Pseudolabrys sp.]|nr:hypothetical protein [Pseudolabrys sp.]